MGLSTAFAVIRIELFEYFNINGVVNSIPPQVMVDPTLYQSVLTLLYHQLRLQS